MNQTKHFYYAVASYLLITLLLLPLFKYNINPDGIMYIMISEKFYNLNFAEAINGCWGPLFPWLIIPSFVIGIEPVLYIKFLFLIIGVLLFFIVKKYADKFLPEERYHYLLYYSLVPLIVYFTYWVLCPDYILLLLLLYYTFLVFREDFLEKKSSSLLIGVLGALMYLTKAYGFPFFLLHFFIFALLKLWRTTSFERKKNFSNAFITLLIFTIISGTWIGLIYNKYGELTISTTGKFNQAFVHPESYYSHQYLKKGLVEIPSPNAITALEDPSMYEAKTWSPFSSIDYFLYQLKLIGKNSLKLLLYTFFFTPFYLLIFFNFKKIKRDKFLVNAFISFLTYVSGYLLLFFETRYVWFPLIIMLMITFKIYTKLVVQSENKKKIVLILSLLFILSTLPISVYALYSKYEYGETEYKISEELKKENVAGRIASNKQGMETLYVAYYLKSKFLGNENRYLNEPDFREKLQQFNIDYFLVWNEPDYQTDMYKEIVINSYPELKVYKIK